MSADQSPLAVPKLRDERVALRPLDEQDLDELTAVVDQPGVREWWGQLDDRERTREDRRHDGAAFAVQVDGELAGWLGFHEENEPDYRHASIDIFLAPPFQDRGLGPAALVLAARWLIGHRGHHRLTIDPACGNERAIRAYAGVGFRPVGVMRRYERGVDRSWHDNLLMDMLADELTGRDSSSGDGAGASR